jgi:hypothetical protein
MLLRHSRVEWALSPPSNSGRGRDETNKKLGTPKRMRQGRNGRPKRRTRSPTGGSANTGGVSYEGYVAAYFAVQILAESAASDRWRYSSEIVLTSIQCQTDHPTDDILLGASHGGRLFLQAKSALNAGTGKNSGLPSVVDQFVRQFLCEPAADEAMNPWKRRFDPAVDRLVMAIGSRSSFSIKQDLRVIVQRVREQLPGQPLLDAAKNLREHRLLASLLRLVQRSWTASANRNPSDPDLRLFLCSIEVREFAVEPNQTGESLALSLLKTDVLVNDLRADSAWNALVMKALEAATNQSGADRKALEQVLAKAQIPIKAARSYRADIEAIQMYTRSTISWLEDFSRIDTGTEIIKIDRPSGAVLSRSIIAGHTIVVGLPGAGKSGSMHDAAERLVADGKDVVFIAADRSNAATSTGLDQEFRIGRPLLEVLDNWPGDSVRYFFIDALVLLCHKT